MKNMMRAGTFASLVIAGCLVGCGGGGGEVTMGSVSSNLTPELMTLNQRPSDVHSALAYQADVNGRLFWEDLGRTWYVDHPSRLNPVEVMHVTGKPR